MQRYLLNTPILPNYGDYRFEGPLPLAQARAYAHLGAQSAIGHEATARYLARELGVAVPFSRQRIAMDVGDSALVLRLGDRLPEGLVLDDAELARQPLEFGLITRVG